jgi:hypothetical protein
MSMGFMDFVLIVISAAPGLSCHASRLERNPRYARLCRHSLRALVFFFRVIMTHGRTDIHFGRHRADVLETTTDVRSRS